MKGRKLTFCRCDSPSNFQQQNNNGTCHFKLGVDILFHGRAFSFSTMMKNIDHNVRC